MFELPDGWRDELPSEIKESGVLDDIKSIDQMATMIVNGRKLQSNQVSIPGEDVTPEKRTEFLADLQAKIPDLVYVGEGADLSNIYDRMGRPKESTEYALGELPEPLKDNFAGLTAKAHEAGVTSAQMKAITDAIVGDYTKNLDLQTNQLDESLGAIKKEYGDATDDKLKAAEGFAKQIGFDEGFAEAIGKGTIGLDNMKAFDKVMDGYGSPGPRIGDEFGDSEGRLTPAQAELKLSEIMNNKQHPYWNGADPAHDDAIAKVVDLTRAADAGKEQSESEKFRDALAGRG
jgi:hypothetical protein